MRNALLALAVAILLAPTAASTWYIGGTFEPDMPAHDTAAWMFQEPPPLGADRVYFAALTLLKGPVGVSPNVGLLQSRLEAPASEFHVAVLGVWKDCNGDGYVGAAEHGFREYSSSLLSNTAVCPPATGSPSSWTAGAHNYNGWVSELVPIGPAGGPGRYYADLDAKVWGDYHRPDERPFYQSCTLQPFPRGTMQDTGGMLNYVECRVEQRLYTNGLQTFNAVVDLVGDPLGLRFESIDDARSGELGQINTFGEESEEHSPAYIWDCSASPTAVPVVGNVWGPSPTVNTGAPPTEWSIAAFGNHTYEGVDAVEDCDPSNDEGRHFYGYFEDDFNGIDPNNKTEADWNFGFVKETRGGPPGGTIFKPGTAGAPNADGGIGWTGYQMSGWYADSWWASKTGPNTVRPDLAGGSVGFAPAHVLTFYAFVSQQTTDRGFALPGTTLGTYGSWHCGSNTSGIHNGWNCDADIWYINPDGSFPDDVTLAGLAKPGWKYQLRDVDCYDGSILGLPTGGPALGPDACA